MVSRPASKRNSGGAVTGVFESNRSRRKRGGKGKRVGMGAVRSVTAARQSRKGQAKVKEPGWSMCVKTLKVCHNPKGCTYHIIWHISQRAWSDRGHFEHGL